MDDQTTQPTLEQSRLGSSVKSRRSRGWILIVGLSVAIITANLAAWQWRRAHYKADLQTQYEALQAQPPLTALDISKNKIANVNQMLAEGTPLALRGRWLSDKTIYLDNRPRPSGPSATAVGSHTSVTKSTPMSNVGYYVLTPFQLEQSGGAILVLRGWLPRLQDERTVLPTIVPADSQTVLEVTGTATQLSSNFMALGQASNRGEGALEKLWQNLDLAEYGRWSGLQLHPFLLRQQASAGAVPDNLQRNWNPPSFGIEKHYGYAAQWAALCLASLVFAGYLWRRESAPEKSSEVCAGRASK